MSATHVALLRGINVGGAGKLPMALLRQVMTELGHRDVATYIQSGNVVFTPAQPGGGTSRSGTSGSRDLRALAAGIEDALEAAAGFRPPTIVLTAAGLVAVRDRNPFPEVTEPKQLHAGFHAARLDTAYAAAAAEAQARAAEKGSHDRVVVDGAVVYLATPDGLGRSVLAPLLGRIRTPGAAATFRNWATVNRLLDLLATTTTDRPRRNEQTGAQGR